VSLGKTLEQDNLPPVLRLSHLVDDQVFGFGQIPVGDEYLHRTFAGEGIPLSRRIASTRIWSMASCGS